MVLFPAPAGPSMAMTRRFSGALLMGTSLTPSRTPLGARAHVRARGRDLDERPLPDVDERQFARRQQPQTAEVKPEVVLAELRERDRRDRERAASQLIPAADAVVIDSTKLGIDEVLARIEELIAEKRARAGHP